MRGYGMRLASTYKALTTIAPITIHLIYGI
jgi:hypothetical protein